MIKIDTNSGCTYPAFSSKCGTIRRANQIVLQANNKYPMVSSTLVDCYENVNKFRSVYESLLDRTLSLRTCIHEIFRDDIDDLEKIQGFVNSIAEYKVGHCAEFAKLAYLAAKTNGIEDITIAGVNEVIFAQEDNVMHVDLKDLDHNELRVENGGKPYIIDLWLKFADFLPEAIQKYQKEFSRNFDWFEYEGDRNLKIEKRTVIWNEDSKFKDTVDRVPVAKLREAFPELILPEPKSTKERKKLSPFK